MTPRKLGAAHVYLIRVGAIGTAFGLRTPALSFTRARSTAARRRPRTRSWRRAKAA